MSDGKKHRLQELDSAALIATILGPAIVTLLSLFTDNALIAGLVYVLAIIAASSAGGVWYGLGAAVLSLIPFVVFFIPPDGFGFATFEDVIAAVVFGATAIAAGVLFDRQRKALQCAGRRAFARTGRAAQSGGGRGDGAPAPALRRGALLGSDAGTGSRRRADPVCRRSRGAGRAHRPLDGRRPPPRDPGAAGLLGAAAPGLGAVPARNRLSALARGAHRRARLHRLGGRADRAVPGLAGHRRADPRARLPTARHREPDDRRPHVLVRLRPGLRRRAQGDEDGPRPPGGPGTRARAPVRGALRGRAPDELPRRSQPRPRLCGRRRVPRRQRLDRALLEPRGEADRRCRGERGDRKAGRGGRSRAGR